MFVLVLSALSSWAQVPFHVELQVPTRLSSIQPLGTQAGSGGGSAGKAQYTPFWEVTPARAYDAACFSVVSGATTASHDLALYSVGVDGRPADLLWYSDSISVGTGGVFCATFTDTDGTVVESSAFAEGLLELAQGEAVWLGFHRSTGTGAAYYRTAYPLTAVPLGQQYPGGPVVRHLQHDFAGWASAPAALDVSNGEPVLVSLQVAAPLYVPPEP